MKIGHLISIVLVASTLTFLTYKIPSANEMHIKQLSNQMRKEYKAKFPKVKKPPFNRLFGSRPRDIEIVLGRQLFSDPIMSRNNDVSCATCHLANHGFADGNSLNVGTMGVGGPNGSNVGDVFGTGVLSTDRTLENDGLGVSNRNFMFRNSLSTLNVIYRQNEFTDTGLFHDGRFGNLRFQVLLPIHTAEEMCGTNPLALNAKGENVFREGGPIFREPVYIKHSNSYDNYSGKDTGRFHAKAEYVKGIPFRRGNNTVSVPNRNECLAITIAKIRSVSKYRKLFKAAYGKKEISDHLLARAIAAYVASHTATNSPFDQFMAGKNSLNERELLGMALYFTDNSKMVKFQGKEYQGAGCINCHDGYTFGGSGFGTIGVRSDRRSPLTQDQSSVDVRTGFFSRTRSQRGYNPKCLVKGLTVFEGTDYAPDIGQAGGTFKRADCFKFRIPPLRNVIESFPYYHHGTETAQGHQFNSLYARARQALKNVIHYHLRGPIDIRSHNRVNAYDPFVDSLFQRDYLVPFAIQNFDSRHRKKTHKKFPIRLEEDGVEALLDFVANGLWDKTATQVGHFGNDISHPKRVPSGFVPSISRDMGTQLELPPRSDSFMPKKKN